MPENEKQRAWLVAEVVCGALQSGSDAETTYGDEPDRGTRTRNGLDHRANEVGVDDGPEAIADGRDASHQRSACCEPVSDRVRVAS